MMHDRGSRCCKSGRCGGCSRQKQINRTEKEKQFLLLLSQIPFLPVARFMLKSAKSEHLESVALAPVYLFDRCDSLEKVKETGQTIKRLAEYGVISLDYELPLENGNYDEYKQSDLFAYFEETVAQGKNNPDFVFDTPSLEPGSIALTGIGQEVLENYEFTNGVKKC